MRSRTACLVSRTTRREKEKNKQKLNKLAIHPCRVCSTLILRMFTRILYSMKKHRPKHRQFQYAYKLTHFHSHFHNSSPRTHSQRNYIAVDRKERLTIKRARALLRIVYCASWRRSAPRASAYDMPSRLYN